MTRQKRRIALLLVWTLPSLVFLSVAAFVCMLLRVFPEYMVLLPTGWILFWLVYGQVAAKYRALPTPPLFPVGDDE